MMEDVHSPPRTDHFKNKVGGGVWWLAGLGHGNLRRVTSTHGNSPCYVNPGGMANRRAV